MRIYFMGVCGTAMGNAALLARAAGHDVLGADVDVYPPMSTVLAQSGIALHEGYDAARLERLAPDLVVIGNAMSRGNPEVEWLLDTRRFAFTSLPAALHSLVLNVRRNIVVCGTHGKTTTTALTAYLLRANGRDPGFLIGGVPIDPPTGNHLGAAADPFVIEGDEYDSAFFDKRSKFIHYAPHIAVLNNLEFDHADIFRDLADVQRTFVHLTRIVPRNGFVVLNGDDENLRALGALPWTNVVRVGTGERNDLRIEAFRESAAGGEFGLSWQGQPWAEVRWPLPGLFNARNAAMAATAAQLALLPRDAARSGRVGELFASAAGAERLDLAALARFRGVKRRQEVLLDTPALTVIEDFGHHPTALAETLHSFRARFPGAILTAVFEPRSNTARTKALEAAFMRSLALADEVYLGAVNRADKLAAGERFDTVAVAQHLEQLGVKAHSAPTNAVLLEKMLAYSGARAERRRVVAFFTNGSFDGIIGKFVAAMSGSSSDAAS
ncbi:UDP-N-acetylmuramate--L-alanine ligase [Opitutus terrae]|uniref:Mur ligase middle domain protein n=1 Tax=Opitutus terrae (strain DSM 11246 / JCM 15787 / PB90-1) TaxID=452637 RepID=B1ZW97_OPITP|nr:Mur ligase family protein [Opitutus terrae]ACB76849.1 Mur ligase middle domain protein [Opitutus terrae PB90-1]